MARVFLVENNPKFGLHNAADFGQIVYLLDKVSPFDIEFFTELLIDAIEEKQFNPAEDLFCLTGHTFALVLAMGVMTVKLNAPIRVLMYDSRTNLYRERTFDPKGGKHEDTRTSANVS